MTVVNGIGCIRVVDETSVELELDLFFFFKQHYPEVVDRCGPYAVPPARVIVSVLPAGAVMLAFSVHASGSVNEGAAAK